MDYKQKYEEALSKAREFEAKGIYGFEEIFPELKESEDEKMRKEIIEYIKDQQSSFISAPDCRDKYEEEENNKYNSWIAWLEKQGKQKHLELKREISAPSDKGEPKFKVGDWIVYCNEDIDLITGIEKTGYLVNQSGYIPFVCEDDIHLWTIQDAKDGDVLNSIRVKATIIFKELNSDGKHVNAYCALQKNILIKQEMLWDRDFEPATKEQRDLLFAKMKEAGYKWDAEKKELKKIEQKPAEWIEDYWQHHKVNNPNSYDKGEEIQFDHQGFIRFCKKYCKNPA